MIDYLEEALDQVQALLEQVQRLERELSGRTPESEGEAQESASPSSIDVEADAASEERTAEAKLEKQIVNREDLSVDDEKTEVYNEVGVARGRTASPLERGEWELSASEKALGAELARRRSSPALETEPADRKSGSARSERLERGQAAADLEPERGSAKAVLEEARRRTAGALEQREYSVQEERRTALLRQTMRLERTAAVAGGGMAGQSRRRDGFVSLFGPAAVFQDAVGETAGGWTAGGGWGRAGALSDRELRWAEQADRAFQRDSRRYDGNFYLY